MKIITSFFLFFTLSVFSQQYTISGYVEDAATGEKLIAANVFDSKTLKGTVTNNYGFFSLTIPKGRIELIVSFVGYQDEKLDFELTENKVLNFALNPDNELDEVVIVGKKHVPIEKRSQMSQIQVNVQDVERIPSLLGEVDLIKALQLLPGVQGGTEGLNGMYVRGGSPDQNLIVLDGVPVYNVSHLFGFLSVFNTDAIKNVTLTKGGFPARFGGRLSSVLEINMKEGNDKEYHGEGSVGILSSRLTFEGPIIKNKSSFLLSGRRNYIDLLARPLIKKAAADSGEDVDFSAYFYDLNMKLNYKLNDNHTLFLSTYLGSDNFSTTIKDKGYNTNDYYKTKGGIDWGNVISALRWNWVLNSKLFSNTTVTYSKFNFNFEAGEEDYYDGTLTSFDARYQSGIYDWGFKTDFDYAPNPNHAVKFGLGDTYHTYNPGAITIKGVDQSEIEDFFKKQKSMFSHELAAYVEDDITFGSLKTNVGLHFSGFKVEDAFYTSVQPRIGMRYLLSDKLSVKASFASMTQYINLLTNESIGLPTDLWVPSTEKIRPQKSWQLAIGGASTLKNGMEASVELYYKEMNDVISYKEGASFINQLESWENKITQGFGQTYGSEFLLEKKNGKTTGWLGYTLSWNNRRFEDVNFGKVYPYKFDRRHDVEIVASHKLSEKVILNGTWVYGTGNAITLSEAVYDISTYNENNNYYNSGYSIDVYGEKNSYRMPAYHRLDVGIEFIKKKKWGERAWNISIYNAYNHRNPFFIYLGENYEYNPNTGQGTSTKAFKQVSIIPILPSFSYRFKF